MVQNTPLKIVRILTPSGITEPVTVRRACDGPSRRFIKDSNSFKESVTVRRAYDGPSCIRRSVLHTTVRRTESCSQHQFLKSLSVLTRGLTTVRRDCDGPSCRSVTEFRDSVSTLNFIMPSVLEQDTVDGRYNSTGKDADFPMKVIAMPRQQPPFPQRLVKKTEDGKYWCFITMLKQLSINVPLVEALEQMPGYAKFMKDLVTKKRSVTFEDDDRRQHCSVIVTRCLVQKKKDPGAFTISCTVGSLYFAKSLCDLGASIKFMPLSIYKKLGLGDPKPTAMQLLMADRTVKRRIGILHNVLVKVESFIFLADFVILDCEVDFEVPIILGRPFLATGRALVDMEKGQMKFRLNNEEAIDICRSMRQSDNSRLPWLPGKLKSKRTGPYLITQVFHHGAVELKTKEGVLFKAHHQEILQKITPLQSLTDTATDRCACDGPSHESVVPGMSFCYLKTRANAMEPTTYRHNRDGPLSGNGRVINEAYPTRPGWGF
ncbi:hypothetical protein EJD97_014680 [Solanum chilense]|uniref:Aspartic peptidase DDI1-type domain-containing protein n=1 Tax=Solanum chilense TaxID=4083 RepID=A0A6N2B9A1_SOLCI|nr:hypothetical protein EJD97_014680 [Solanum chilense]